MTIVFIIIILVLVVLLYKMLGQTEQTYTYNRTMTVTFLPDGSEQTRQQEESGVIFLAGRIVTIDGEKYVCKSPDRQKIQARLVYEGGNLKSVNLLLSGGGEKFYYVDRKSNLKS